MPYALTFRKPVAITDREQYVNDCCIGGDLVIARESRIEHALGCAWTPAWLVWNASCDGGSGRPEHRIAVPGN